MQTTPYITIFLAVFLAELGDKTQLATVLFASDKQMQPGWVFIAAAAALTASTAIAVLAGTYAGKYLTAVPLKLIAGFGFVVIGLWTLYDYSASPV